MGRHIFHHAHDRNLYTVKQLNAFGGIHQRHILRCRHNHRARYWNALRQRQLNIACTRRHINHQHI